MSQPASAAGSVASAGYERLGPRGRAFVDSAVETIPAPGLKAPAPREELFFWLADHLDLIGGLRDRIAEIEARLGTHVALLDALRERINANEVPREIDNGV